MGLPQATGSLSCRAIRTLSSPCVSRSHAYGAVLVPINFMLKPPEIAYVLRHAGAGLLCTDSKLRGNRAAAALDSAIEALVGLPSEGTGEPHAEISFARLAATEGSDADFASPSPRNWRRSSTPAERVAAQGRDVNP